MQPQRNSVELHLFTGACVRAAISKHDPNQPGFRGVIVALKKRREPGSI